ncbi:MAG: restriction endonuclease subunit S [Cyanobacteria bacterium J06554_6]
MRSKTKSEKLEVRGEKGRQDKSFSVQNSQCLIPRLRFPEFRNEPSWPEHQLGDKAVILKGKGISKADLDPTGSQPCIRYGELYTRYSETISEVISRTKIPASELFLSNLDDVIIPSSGETKIDIAKASCVLANDIALGGDLNVIRSKLNGTFLSYYLNGPKRFDIAKVAQGDTVVHLYPHQLKALQVAVPSQPEQQKIAECLSLVDEAIAAQARKLDALKTHKKGLMQQLFPRKGETQPRLRFPEFQNAGAWTVLPLADLADRIMVGIASAATHAYCEAGVLMLRNQNIKEGGIDDSSLLFIDPDYEVAHKNKRLRTGDVITVRTGYPGLSAVVTERYKNAQCFTSLITRPKKDVLDSDYLCLYINSPIGRQFILGAEAGGAQKNVNVGALKTLEVYLPRLEEQRKIASCLSSLDDLITAETQKHEALKTHKRGLMQQLFPSPEEADA